MVAALFGNRSILAPEVVQSSTMDCGPASLKCLLEGHGIRTSYGRLREACQTDVDGTSIDVLEDVARELGLEAQQVMMPPDHVLLTEAAALPAIAVIRLPSGANHFVVVWRAHGGFVQVMDPATGRRWTRSAEFLRELYQHNHPAPAQAWRKWAATEEFLGPLRRRLCTIGLRRSTADALVSSALQDTSWRGIAALDAAARMVEAMTHSNPSLGPRQACDLVQAVKVLAMSTDDSGRSMVPAAFWSVHPAMPGSIHGLEDQECVIMRGAVLVRAPIGRRLAAPTTSRTAPSESSRVLSPELLAALNEPSARAGRDLLRMLKADGMLAPLFMGGAMGISAVVVLIEALLFRGLLDIGRFLALFEQRVSAMAMLMIFALAAMLLEFPIASGALRFGRRLEARMRMAFLQKIPRLNDRYFHSRLTSDMAERSHSIQALRQVPGVAMQLLRASFALMVTTAGIIWLDPRSAPVALSAAALAVFIPLVCLPLLGERAMRVRTHAGALSRFYFDALVGLLPIRAHGAQRAMRREHESLLSEWMRSSLLLQKSVVVIDIVQSLTMFGLAIWLMADHFGRSGEAGSMLLLVYWALSLPAHGQEIALLARQYPNLRSVALRVMEPLGAPEHAGAASPPSSRSNQSTSPSAESELGIAIEMRDVSVKAAGHLILNGINLHIKPGEHLAIVGPSGAGKSSLVGLLLGWHQPATGSILVDGQPLDDARLVELRAGAAWVDPIVQLWNRSLLENLRYGAGYDLSRLATVLQDAELVRLISELPEGLQTPLGEGGGLVSGGEGQRVRLGRAMLRDRCRLVVFDEPFRGLDRDKRIELLARARELWRHATLLCITHDISQALDFDRVLVLEHGQLIEVGAPGELRQRIDGRFRELLDCEHTILREMWAGQQWRRLLLTNGTLIEGHTASQKSVLIETLPSYVVERPHPRESVHD